MKPKKPSTFARRIRGIAGRTNPYKTSKPVVGITRISRKKLSSKTTGERLFAMHGIEMAHDKKSIPKLIEIAKTDTIENRAAAIETIGQIGTAKHIRFILSFGGSKSEKIRKSALLAVEFIAERYPTESTKILFLYGFNHKDPEFRKALMRNLSALGINTPKK